MFSKLVLLSTTNFLTRRKTISIELVELVDSVEKVLLLTSSFQTTPSSLERFKIITTLKLKRCHKTLRTSILAESNEQLLGEPTYKKTKSSESEELTKHRLKG